VSLFGLLANDLEHCLQLLLDIVLLLDSVVELIKDELDESLDEVLKLLCVVFLYWFVFLTLGSGSRLSAHKVVGVRVVMVSRFLAHGGQSIVKNVLELLDGSCFSKHSVQE